MSAPGSEGCGPPTHLVVATPTVDGTVLVAYQQTLLSVARACHASGITYEVRFTHELEVRAARNQLANQALSDPEGTFLLWIDSDMDIPFEVLVRMLTLRRPVVGVVATVREMNLDAYATARAQGASDQVARAMASSFIFRSGEHKIDLDDPMPQVEGVGFGCVLHDARLLHRLAASGLCRRYAPTGARGYSLIDFFQRVRTPHGTWLTEDYSFCERLRELGVPIVAISDGDIGHVGPRVFHATVADWARAHERLPTPR